MSVNSKDVHKAAELAALECSEHNETHLLEEISSIMAFVDTLKACDTKGIAPLFQPFDLHKAYREDIPDEQSLLEELESIAPQMEGGLYLVPKVLDDE